MFGKSKMKMSRVLTVPIGKVKPNVKQPRRQFEQESLLELAQSIRQNGILQPLTVRAAGTEDYELVAGERRLRAALIAGLTQVPCIEIEADDSQAAVFSLLENLQRQDLSFFEEADGIARLIETYGLTQEEVASRLGKSQSTVANKLRLRRLNQAERQIILSAGLTERHARSLLRLDEKERATALKQIIEKDLNVSETEHLVESIIFADKEKPASRNMPVIKDIRLFMNTVTNAVNIMKRSGIDAVAEKREYDDYFEYTVRIPKTQQNQTAS